MFQNRLQFEMLDDYIDYVVSRCSDIAWKNINCFLHMFQNRLHFEMLDDYIDYVVVSWCSVDVACYNVDAFWNPLGGARDCKLLDSCRWGGERQHLGINTTDYH